MDFVEKARVRLEHWLSHNDHHVQEYADFADEVERAGKAECARQIREMADHVARSTECLKKAISALERS